MGKIAFVFAGQGAQYVGMGKDLYEKYDTAKMIFQMLGEKAVNLIFHGPAAELNTTINTQPCLFAMDLACGRVLHEQGVFADAVAGFSLGEISAVAYSGMMSDQEAFELVSLRAGAMQACAEENKGNMFAVLKLSVDEIESICRDMEHVYPVNYNCPGQTVVACSLPSTEPLQNRVTAKGGKMIQLAVSGAFHSPFMHKASDQIAKYLANKEFKKMQIPVYANVTATPYQHAKELLALQVKSPVLWQKSIENMIEDGIDTFIEVGAGKTLSGLIKKINNAVRVFNVCGVQSLENTVREVNHAS